MKFPLLAGSLLALVTAASAALDNRAATVTSQTVALGGVACPEVVAWSGGESRSAVVTVRSGGGGNPGKSLGTLSYEPLVLEVAPPLSAALQACLAEFLNSGTTRRTLLLSRLDANGQAVGDSWQASGAVLTEVEFPTLEAAASTPTRLKLVFRAESVTPTATTAPLTGGGGNRRAAAVTSAFKLMIDALASQDVRKIDRFTIRRELVTHASGGGGAQAFSTGALTVPDLVVTLGNRSVPDWQAWRASFLPQDTAPQTLSRAQVRNGTLQLLSSDLQTPLVTLQLSKLAPFHLAVLPTPSGGGPLQLRAELYCEAMTIATGGEPVALTPANASPATPAVVATTPAPVSATEPTLAPPGSDPALTPGAATPAAVAPVVSTPGATRVNPLATPEGTLSPPAKVLDREPVAVKNTPTLRAGLPAASTSPEDQGLRDPADFPRPAGVVRTGYSSTREPTQVREYAYYTGSTKSADLIAFYEETLSAQGWQESSRQDDNGGPKKSYRIISSWVRGKRSVQLTIGDVAPEKTDFEVRLHERK